VRPATDIKVTGGLAIEGRDCRQPQAATAGNHSGTDWEINGWLSMWLGHNTG
jgi:hypothetical protein